MFRISYCRPTNCFSFPGVLNQSIQLNSRIVCPNQMIPSSFFARSGSLHINFSFLFPCTSKPPQPPTPSPFGQDILIVQIALRFTYSVGTNQTSDQLITEAANYTTQSKHNRSICLTFSEIRSRNPSYPVAADKRLRPNGQWNRHLFTCNLLIYIYIYIQLQILIYIETIFC